MGNRGGARPNTGPKKAIKQYSDDFKARLWKSLKAKSVELGYRDVFEALSDLAMNMEKHHSNANASAWKIIADVMTVKESLHTVEKGQGPQIYLPEKREWDGKEEIGKEGQGRQEGAETSGKVLRH